MVRLGVLVAVQTLRVGRGRVAAKLVVGLDLGVAWPICTAGEQEERSSEQTERHELGVDRRDETRTYHPDGKSRQEEGERKGRRRCGDCGGVRGCLSGS